MSKSIEDLLRGSQGVILTTIDRMGFPKEPAIFITGIQKSLLFNAVYSRRTISVDSIFREKLQGYYMLFTTNPFKAVYIKGIITIQEEVKEIEFQEYIQKYPKLEKIIQPVGIDFQALSVEVGHAATINQDNSEIEEIIDW